MLARKVAFVDVEASKDGTLALFTPKSFANREGQFDPSCKFLHQTPVSALFRLYFPVNVEDKVGQTDNQHTWFPYPQDSYAAGIVNYKKLWPSSIIKWFISFMGRQVYLTDMVALDDNPRATVAEGSGKGKLLVLSHGLCGCRTMYSHWIHGMVLRHGYTVISMEHRDGSACTSFTFDGKEVPFLSLSHLPDCEALEIRKHQLQFRSSEIDIALNAIRKQCSHDAKSAFQSKLSKYVGFDVGDIQMAGHSFGAASCIYHSSLKKVSAIFLMDPWMIPLKQFPVSFEECSKNTKKVFIVNSDSFHWKENLDELHKYHDTIAGDKGETKDQGNIFVSGTSHMDFSDFSVVFPSWFSIRAGFRGKDGGSVLIDKCVSLAHETFSTK